MTKIAFSEFWNVMIVCFGMVSGFFYLITEKFKFENKINLYLKSRKLFDIMFLT